MSIKIHQKLLQFFIVDPIEEYSLSERTKVNICFWFSLWLVVLGLIFLTINFRSGIYGLVVINTCSTLLGAVSLYLLSRKLFTQAGALLCIGAALCFSVSGYLFKNGMELMLLLGIIGGGLLFDSRWGRFFAAGLNAVLFLLVKVALYKQTAPGEFPLERYATNVIVFLLVYYVVLMVFRHVHSSYRTELEGKNRELALSREELKQQHLSLLEKSRELKEANHAKERLFSVVSHDLRGPIGNLKMMIELLKNGDLSTEAFQGAIEELYGEVDHVNDCLETLLIWASSQLGAIQPQFEAVPLRRVVEKSVAMYAEVAQKKEVHLTSQVPSEAFVWADENQLSSVIRNLISNAIKFTQKGGSVVVRGEEEAGGWLISVTDTGVGMDAKALGDLRATGSAVSTLGTQNEKGLGLGLRICFEFVASLGGKLRVSSQEGEGSRFEFYLKEASRGGVTRVVPLDQSVRGRRGRSVARCPLD